MPTTQKMSLWAQLTSLNRPFWMVNLMEILERAAYYGVRVVIPIYIAQADAIGGLHFTQVEKGLIFTVWAVVESLTPLISGGFADRYGFKTTITFSVAIKVVGYILMATQREFWPFLFGCSVLALGTATFKPGVQGTMCQTMTRQNSSVGWGSFYMLVNIGAFLGPPIAHFLYGISWSTLFYGCAALVSLNFLILFTYKDPPSGGEDQGGPVQVVINTIRNLFNLRLIVFILITSGFWLMLMQLFDMLPNFIVDWVDSSRMVNDLNLPEHMLQTNSTRGSQLSQEWLINANAGLIVLSVVFISAMVARMRRVLSITLGMTVASVGLLVAGYTTSGYICLAGILIFSVGEMLASPKMQDYLGTIAPDDQKGLYMGYVNIPRAVGWGLGSYWAGSVYDKMGDKANLALDYLATNYNITGLERTEAMNKLIEVTGLDAIEATNMLWKSYEPFTLWLPFAAVGLAAAVGMLFYSNWVKQHATADA
jgi:dipeptide/tripeptide permease